MDKLPQGSGHSLIVIQLIFVFTISALHLHPFLDSDLSTTRKEIYTLPARPSASPRLSYQVEGINVDELPILLQLLVTFLGNDWLGADWLYLGFADSSDVPGNTDPGNTISGSDASKQSQASNFPRFWTDPGPALLNPGDSLWVWSVDVGSYNVYADSLLVNPPAGVAPPDEVLVFGKVRAVGRDYIDVLDIRGLRYTILVDKFTAFTLLPGGMAEPRPMQGLWLDISWLTGHTGLLGRYARFHGTCRGYLRLDFHCP